MVRRNVDHIGERENLNTQSGADVVIAALRANGINSMFALPGGQLDHLFDAVQRTNGEFKLTRTRHEQSAAYMAFGSARSTGQTAVFSVVPGPGIMNAMGALANAWAVAESLGGLQRCWRGRGVVASLRLG